MTSSRFLQIHTLHSYPGVLLNRDDAGLAKRLPFGGAVRTRISSQCLKRHWRMAEDDHALSEIGVPMGKRSRLIVQRRIFEPMVRDHNVAEDIADAVAEAFLKKLFDESKKRSRAGTEKQDADDRFATPQAVLFGLPEIEYLAAQALAVAQGAADAKAAKAAAEAFFKDTDVKKNLAAMKHGAGLEAALFGRMVTSDLIANTDAAIHVAHAFTVHEQESESDYFTVVDDLKGREQGDDQGSAGLFEMELTSGLYYGYVVVDVPALVSNLEGCRPEDWDAEATDRDVPARVVEHLCHLIAKVSPGAKLGATAPYGWAQMMLVEAGDRQPRSLANAFRDPVNLGNGQILFRTTECLGRHLGAYDGMYGGGEARRIASLESGIPVPGADPVAFDDLARWAGEAVRRAAA